MYLWYKRSPTYEHSYIGYPVKILRLVLIEIREGHSLINQVSHSKTRANRVFLEYHLRKDTLELLGYVFVVWIQMFCLRCGLYG